MVLKIVRLPLDSLVADTLNKRMLGVMIEQINHETDLTKIYIEDYLNLLNDAILTKNEATYM